MTIQTDHVQGIFQDAHDMQSAAVERLEAGDIRDAAEKAWCATKRATEALILSKKGELPPNSTRVSAMLRGLGRDNDALRALTDHFGATARYLHNDCFYNGSCDPVEDTERRIRETAGYIENAERLADRP